MPALCEHCGLPSAAGRFCCRGCEAAFALICSAGLDDYDLRDRPITPVTDGEISTGWIEPIAAEIAASPGISRQRMSVAGVTCAACVWLIERSFRRREGGRHVLVNPARGRVEIAVEPSFDLEGWARDLAAVGYRLGPEQPLEATDDRSITRVGVAAAIALNAMVIAAAVYLGLDSGPIHDVFLGVSVALGLASAAIGGGYFGGRAIRALRAGVVSFDLPIAAAIALVFAASLWAALSGRAAAVYFDSLCVFVALVLGGRLLAERVLAANRRKIASADDQLTLRARRVEGDEVRSVATAELRAGDVIVVSAGELVPTDAELVDDRAGVRLDWITGESEPRLLERGAAIEAGAINAARTAFRARVIRPQAASPLAALLTTPADEVVDNPGLRPWLAPVYLTIVATAAAAGFLLWLDAGAGRALEVAAAILVVTCPCALGIGVPLAFELIAGGLRRDGVFVRRATALDRLPRIARVGFDKTGTLTEGRLAVEDAARLEALAPDDRRVLFNLAVRSAHPKSRAIADAMSESFDPELEVTELPGVGLEATRRGARYRLAAGAGRRTAFSRDGRILAAIELAEVIRADAAAEIAALEAEGVEVHLITGDVEARAREVAAATAHRSRAGGRRRPPRGQGGLGRGHRSRRPAVCRRRPQRRPGPRARDRLGDPGERPAAGRQPRRLLFHQRRDLADPRRPRRIQTAGADHPGPAGLRVRLQRRGRRRGARRADAAWLAAVLMPASSIAVVAGTAIAARHPRRRP
jgi:Cu2+-exporting ATPase